MDNDIPRIVPRKEPGMLARFGHLAWRLVVTVAMLVALAAVSHMALPGLTSME